MNGKLRMAQVCLVVLAVAVLGAGCPQPSSGSPDAANVKSGRVTVLIGSATKSLSQALLEAVAPKSVVAANEIYSLTLTVTEISLDQEGDDDHGDDDHGDHGGDVEDDNDHHGGDIEDDNDHHGGDHGQHGDDKHDDGDDDSSDDDGGDHHGDDDEDSVVIFQGAQDVNLVSLENLSQVFSANDIPAGVYHRITLKIENPRLRLTSDPETEITDIHLTCNDRLIVDATFEIPESGNSLISLTFNGVHLIREGNGTYVLTPHLDASVSVTSADVMAVGTIASVDTGTASIVVTLADGDVTVLYSGAAIFLPTDTDTPTGTESDLVVGASVEIVGTIGTDGLVTATEIYIL